MTEPGSSNVRDTAETVKGIVEAVPIYEDLAQPAAQELGRGLEIAAKAVVVCLAPLKVLVWGYEQVEEFLKTSVAEKLSETPPEDIVSPKPHVAGPAIEALKYTGHEDSLRELYANLLAASMDVKTASLAHPSFVEIIRQLTPDEARLLAYFANQVQMPVISVQSKADDGGGEQDVLVNFSLFAEGAQCEHTYLVPAYLDNLSRLGLIEIPDRYYIDQDAYDDLENRPSIVELKSQIDKVEGRHAEMKKKVVIITRLGDQFIKACVLDHRSST